MRKEFDKLTTNLNTFGESLEEFISVTPQSNEFVKRIANLNKLWTKVQTAANELENFVRPVETLDIKIPKELNCDKFIEAWKYWKDYLTEQHGITILSRMEIKALKLLFDLSECDPDKAIKLLEYAEAKGSRSFYKVDELTKKKEYDPDFR